MSTVLLGVPDTLVGSPTTWDVNKIGGHPDPMIPLSTPNCEGCSSLMLHVLQIYCPLELSPFHRSLHVFACTARSCWNKEHGWRVFRSQLRDYSTCQEQSASDSSASKSKVAMETSDWCDDADDWGCDDDAQDLVAMVTDSSKVVGTESTTAAVYDTTESPATSTSGQSELDEAWCEDAVVSGLGGLNVEDDDAGDTVKGDDSLLPSEKTLANVISYLATDQPDDTGHGDGVLLKSSASQSTPLLSYHLNVFDEPSSDVTDEIHVAKMLKDYERAERVDVRSLADDDREPKGGKKSASVEKYEKTELKHGDKCFHKFMKRIKRCPEQVIRYYLGGTPLPISASPMVPRPCPVCGAARVFELQLVPSLVPYLCQEKEQGPVLEFGTVLVYTCSRSCWEEALQEPREELVIVQSDPDQHLFKS
ncbi:LOW QUALITY PROTEIN: programmed cell death protein 2-like [Haliotis rubra]|uniref:LOW QUALITY PROTEIN: programmed cell death protein 2-like n=1 Tax=Haliotis rubra TaxID=36100 RepID=UPI001EE61A1C|nr:LOW QUALITY PROTEIN: programmed cell death protein 2-like [Haliotis rubra]